MADKIDSNITGLRYAEEVALRTLPGTPIWYPLEPNSYSDFGGQIATVARNPINPSRQRKKGVTTDLDASGGFNQDLTTNNFWHLAQGFFFADVREKTSNLPTNGVAVPCTSVTAADDKYNFGADPGTFLANNLINVTGFNVVANNGLKLVVSTDADDITVGSSPGLSDEASPPATAKIQVVGHQFASADLSVVLNGNYVRLTSAAFDMTTLGLIAGEWIFVGGDSATLRFLSNQGWGRVNAVTTTYIELDKTSWTGATEAGTGLTVQIFFGDLLKNESDPDMIVRRTYQVERTLGEDDNGTMSEYLVGAVPNEMTVNVAQADKVTMDLSFVAVDNEQRNGTVGPKTGTRPALNPADAFNTSSDFARIKLALVDETDSSPVALFGYATEMTLTLNNNVTPNKAIGVLGAFDTSAGTFEVGGNVTAYFSSIEAVQAVRDNGDVTIDMILVKGNKGLLFDIPLLSLGDGRLNVQQDEAITLPLETNAAESKFNSTLAFMSFAYLPDLAM